MPRWASDVTVLWLNTGITVYRGKPTVYGVYVCVFCTLSSVEVCKYVLSLCKLLLHCLEHALKNFTHQGTCAVIIKSDLIGIAGYTSCFVQLTEDSPKSSHGHFRLVHLICVCSFTSGYIFNYYFVLLFLFILRCNRGNN